MLNAGFNYHLETQPRYFTILLNKLQFTFQLICSIAKIQNFAEDFVSSKFQVLNDIQVWFKFSAKHGVLSNILSSIHISNLD